MKLPNRSLASAAASAAKWLLLSALVVGVASAAPIALLQGVLDDAASTTSATIRLTTSVGPTVGHYAFIGTEVLQVRAVNGRQITVLRGVNGSVKASHASGAVVWFGPLGAFVSSDLSGACDINTVAYEPLLSTASGTAWACQGGVWVPLAAGSGITGDASTNTSTSVDGEVALFSGTFGKTIRRGNALTGVLKASAGVLSPVTGTGTNCVLVNGTSSPCSGGGTWGSITGTLSSQTDLQTALNAKGDASTNTASSVDGELSLFSGTGGKTLKRATLTGVLKATSGVASVVSGTGSDCVRVDGTSGACSGGSSTGLVTTKDSGTQLTTSTGEWMIERDRTLLATPVVWTWETRNVTDVTYSGGITTFTIASAFTGLRTNESLNFNGFSGSCAALNGVLMNILNSQPATTLTASVGDQTACAAAYNSFGGAGGSAVAGSNPAATGMVKISAAAGALGLVASHASSMGMVLTCSGGACTTLQEAAAQFKDIPRATATVLAGAFDVVTSFSTPPAASRTTCGDGMACDQTDERLQVAVDATVARTNGTDFVGRVGALAGLNLGSQTSPMTLEIANAGTTGTTINKLAKLTGAPSTAVITSTSDTNGAVGVVMAGAGTTGNAMIARSGVVLCAFDGATTAGHWVKISTTTAGSCNNAGATRPTSGQVIGRVLETIGSAGNAKVLLSGEDSESAVGGTGLTSLNSQTGGTQTFANDTNVTISSATNTHTLGWTGTLAAARGGTGTGTYTTGDILYASATNTLSKRAAGTAGQVLTMVSGVPDWAAPTGGAGGLTATATVDFASVVDGACVSQSMAATGFTTGMAITVGPPSTLEAGLNGLTAFVLAADTVALTICNHSGGTINPAPATYRVTQAQSYITATGTIDFASMVDGTCDVQTMTLTGVQTGNSIAIGPPSTLEAGIAGLTAFVSSANTVSIRACNWSGATVNPASATYRATLN